MRALAFAGVFLAVVSSADAAPGRKLMSAPAPIGGAFNKGVYPWTTHQISYINQFTITNVGTTSQEVKVTAYVENLVWEEYNSAATVRNPFPVTTQVVFNTFGSMISGTPATWNAAESRYELVIDTKTIGPGKAASFDAAVRFKGPIGDPGTTLHLLATASLRYLVEISEDRGAVTAAHRIFGNNGYGGCANDSNMANLSPVFYAVNGGRPF